MIKEEDWKIFRARVPLWQKAYVERINKEYLQLLNGESDEIEKFWTLERRIGKDKKSSGIFIARMSRNNMQLNLLRLLQEGVIELKDLEGFSIELIETIKVLL